MLVWLKLANLPSLTIPIIGDMLTPKTLIIHSQYILDMTINK